METFEKRPLLPNLCACLCRAYLPFRQTGQTQILILEILQCIPAVKIFAFLDPWTKLNIFQRSLHGKGL